MLQVYRLVSFPYHYDKIGVALGGIYILGEVLYHVTRYYKWNVMLEQVFLPCGTSGLFHGSSDSVKLGSA